MEKINSLILIFIFYLLVCTGCFEKNSQNPEEVYKLWAGHEPPKELQLVHGKYWQSGHCTREYILYLELKAPDLWRNEYKTQNHLVPDSSNEQHLSDAPAWFTPTQKYKAWIQPGGWEGSTFYEDSATGHVYIYEIQL